MSAWIRPDEWQDTPTSVTVFQVQSSVCQLRLFVNSFFCRIEVISSLECCENHYLKPRPTSWWDPCAINTYDCRSFENGISNRITSQRNQTQAYRVGANQVSCFLLLPPPHFLSLPSFPVFSSLLLSSSGYKVQAGLKARVFIPQLLTSGITGTYHYISTFLSKYWNLNII